MKRMFLWNTMYSTDFVKTPVTEYKETAPTLSSRYETVKLYSLSWNYVQTAITEPKSVVD